MGGRIISVLCAILAIVGAVFLVRGYKNYNAEQESASKVYAELSLKLSGLESERRAVKGEILQLEESIANASGTGATLNIIFTGMSEKIYTEALPVMKEHGFTGTIAMAKEELSGRDGLLSDGQIATLVSEGWDIIPRYSENDGVLGIEDAVEWIVQYGFDAKATVMVDEEYLTPEVEENLAVAGYETVVVMAEGAEGAVVSDRIGMLWKPRAVGYLTDGRKDILGDAIGSKGHVIFTVGFDEEVSAECYNAKMLSSMLGYIDDLRDEGEILCSGIHDMRLVRAEADVRRDEAETGVRERLDECNTKLEEIDHAIAELYKEYK